MKKELAYLLAASKELIFAAANVAISINRFSVDSDYDILLYYHEVDDRDRLALSKIPHLILKKLSFPEGFRDALLSTDKGLPKGRWDNPDSLLAFAHYEIFDLLSEYRKVIWLDVDISIQSEISSLKNFGPLGLAKDYDSSGMHIWKVRNQFRPGGTPLNYDMEADSDLNALIVVDETLPNHSQLTEYCYKKTVELARDLVNPDQAIFQLMKQDFNIETNEISWKKYICHCASPDAALANIVHFGGNRKIWDSPLLCQCFPEWVRVHHIWVSMGGRDYNNLATSRYVNSSIYSTLSSVSFTSRLVLRNLLRTPYRLIKSLFQ